MSDSEDTFLPLADNYEMIERMGAGYLTPYLARHTILKHEVAFWRRTIYPSNSDNSIERFQQAAIIQASLQHPNIEPVYDCGIQNGDVFYIVKPAFTLRNDTLRSRLFTNQNYSIREILEIIRQIGHALDYMHTRGFVHCNVKPDNITFDNGNNAFLTDFFMTTKKDEYHDDIMFTPFYAAPEVFMENEFSPGTDLYALAVIAFEMIAGITPFSDRNFPDLIMKIRNDPVPSLRNWRSDTPAIFDLIFQKALDKRPSLRYQSAQDFIYALEDAATYIGKYLRIFISYAKLNKEPVNKLAKTLDALGHSVWFDKELINTGGQNWWDNILKEIQNADLFVFALSPTSLQSYPCQLEYTYAHQLGKRILPVVITPVNYTTLPAPLASLQWVDFTLPDSHLSLKTSIEDLPPPIKLSDAPLPNLPNIPVSELNYLAEQIATKILSVGEQNEIIIKLKILYAESETSDGAAQLLKSLQNRPYLNQENRETISRIMVSGLKTPFSYAASILIRIQQNIFKPVARWFSR